MIKLLSLGVVYILISAIGMAAASGYSSVDLQAVDGVLVALVGVGLIVNLVGFVANVVTS